jgi:hypothetical protein
MTSPTDQPKEAQMLSKKIRTILTGAVVAGALAVAAIVPAVSQAQWHTICTAGHCTTHKNFTIGGKSPCENIKENLNKAQDGLLSAIDTRPLRIGGPSVTQVEKERSGEIEREEGRVREAERASFEWGCQVPA